MALSPVVWVVQIIDLLIYYTITTVHTRFNCYLLFIHCCLIKRHQTIELCSEMRRINALFCHFPSVLPRLGFGADGDMASCYIIPTILNFDFIWGFLYAHRLLNTSPLWVLGWTVGLQEQRPWLRRCQSRLKSASQLLPSLPWMVSSLPLVISLWPDIAILSLLAFSGTGNRGPISRPAVVLTHSRFFSLDRTGWTF